MDLSLHSISSGDVTGNVAVSEDVFGNDFNEPLVHQVVTAFMAGSRAGTKAQKTRSERRGGGIKPWRQKGSGRARAGSIRSPIWRGGGKAFAAKPRNYEQKVNRKMYRGAIRSILSELVRQERLVVVESLAIESGKTRDLIAQLKQMDAMHVLLVAQVGTDNLFLASRNVPNVLAVDLVEVNPVLLVGFEKVVIERAALEALGESLQ